MSYTPSGFFGPPEAEVPLEPIELEPDERADDVVGNGCVCPGISDDPDCPRHGQSS